MDKDLRSVVAWVVHILNGLAVLVGTCYLLWHYIQLDKNAGPMPEGAALVSSVGWALAVGAALVVVNVLRLLYLRPIHSVYEDYILSQGSDGNGVRVAIEAIRSELRLAAEEVPEVSRCKVAVLRPGPRRVKIQVGYVACEGSNIMELSERLRAVVRERFQDMVPLAEGVKQEVEIDFESFGGKPPKNAPEAKEEKAGPPPFTGPKYPVDGEM